MRRLHLISPYSQSHVSLDDDDFILIQERGQDPEKVTIVDFINLFRRMPSVNVFGIIRSEIEDIETKVFTNINLSSLT